MVSARHTVAGHNLANAANHQRALHHHARGNSIHANQLHQNNNLNMAIRQQQNQTNFQPISNQQHRVANQHQARTTNQYGRHFYGQAAQNTSSVPRGGFEGSHTAPWRKTVSIFKQPVTLVHTTSRTTKAMPPNTAPQANTRVKDKPKQVFWVKRLECVRAMRPLLAAEYGSKTRSMANNNNEKTTEQSPEKQSKTEQNDQEVKPENMDTESTKVEENSDQDDNGGLHMDLGKTETENEKGADGAAAEPDKREEVHMEHEHEEIETDETIKTGRDYRAVIEKTALPNRIQTLGPDIVDLCAVASLNAALSNPSPSCHPVMGQTNPKRQIDSNVAAYINCDQPLMQAVVVHPDDIHAQEKRVVMARLRLEELRKHYG